MSSCLVIQLARLGDLIQSKRLILGLAAAYGNSGLHLLVDKSLSDLAENMFPFATVHGIRATGGDAEPAELMAENHAALAALAETPFSAVYNLNYSGLSLALSTLFPPEILHGHWLEKGMARRSRWVDLAFRWTARRRTSPLNLIDFWGLMLPQPLPLDAVNPIAKPGGEGIGVVVAGRMARRSLDPDILAPLVSAHFARLGGTKIMLFGGAAERLRARRLTQELPTAVREHVVDFTGKTTLTDLPEIFGGLDVLISPDTGLMHLGAHCGTPLDAIFLSSAWCYETGPYGLGHTVRQAAPQCAPCLEAAPCPHIMRCLTPFKSHALHRLMAGKEGTEFPFELLTLTGGFDGLGINYIPVEGQEEHARSILPQNEVDTRLGMRFMLTEFLGLDAKGLVAPAMDVQQSLQEQLFQESDWLLPGAKLF